MNNAIRDPLQCDLTLPFDPILQFDLRESESTATLVVAHVDAVTGRVEAAMGQVKVLEKTALSASMNAAGPPNLVLARSAAARDMTTVVDLLVDLSGPSPCRHHSYMTRRKQEPKHFRPTNIM